MDLYADGLVVLNLVIIESLLSIDNAAVLATMAMDLPKEQRPKALKYGLLGAYFFRGLALLFASLLVKVWWLKVLGGLYLLYLSIHYFMSKQTKTIEDDTFVEMPGFFRKYLILPLSGVFSVLFSPFKKASAGFKNSLGKFWYTVAMIEIMDLAFSVDNVFAAVAFTKNIVLICIGVFIGILAMRFVAQYFIKLMETFHFLESVAFIVIGILGLKLSASLPCYFMPEDSYFCQWMESEQSEWILSISCLLIFLLPVLYTIIVSKVKSSTRES